MSNDTSLHGEDGRRAVRGGARYAELLAELASSGKSTAAFARERGIAPWKLYNALKTRSRKGKGGQAARRSSTLVPVRVIDGPSSPSPLELVLPGDVCVRIGPGFDEASLRRLLDVLGQC